MSCGGDQSVGGALGRSIVREGICLVALRQRAFAFEASLFLMWRDVPGHEIGISFLKRWLFIGRFLSLIFLKVKVSRLLLLSTISGRG